MIDAIPKVPAAAVAPLVLPAAKRSRTGASSSHLACAGPFVCEQAVPLRTFRFDPTASGPAGQQASLERQGWVGMTRERLAPVCPFDDCGGFVMEFVAASVALGAATYQERLCKHQFAANRACGSKWMVHCGTGATATNKQRPSRCGHAAQVPSIMIASPSLLRVAPAADIPARLASRVRSRARSLSSSDSDSAESEPDSEHGSTESDNDLSAEIETPDYDTDIDFHEMEPARDQRTTNVADPASLVSLKLSRPVIAPLVHSLADIVVTVALPPGVTLDLLTTAPIELLDPANVGELILRMRAFLPPVSEMAPLIPREIDQGIAELRDGVVSRMAASFAHHRLVSSTAGGSTYEVKSQYRAYRATKRDFHRFVEAVANESAWRIAMWNDTKDPPTTNEEARELNKIGRTGPYRGARAALLVAALVSVLFPKFAETSTCRTEDYVKSRAPASERTVYGWY